MKNKDKITLLKAKVIKLKEQLKSAQKTCAKQDNEIYELKCQLGYINNSEFKDAIDNLATFGKQNIGQYFEEMKKAFEKLEVSSLTEKYKPNPIESTQELFEGKGCVYRVTNDGTKMYYCGDGRYVNIKSESKIFEWNDKEMNNLLSEGFHFEPIKKENQREVVTIKL